MLSRTEKMMDMVNTVNEENEDDDLCESCDSSPAPEMMDLLNSDDSDADAHYIPDKHLLEELESSSEEEQTVKRRNKKRKMDNRKTDGMPVPVENLQLDSCTHTDSDISSDESFQPLIESLEEHLL